MAKIDLSFLWESFAIAAGVPPSTWQTVSGDKVAVVPPDENRFVIQVTSRVRHCVATSLERNHMSGPSMASNSIEATTLRKLRIRLLPLLFVLFVLAFIDRINLGLPR